MSSAPHRGIRRVLDLLANRLGVALGPATLGALYFTCVSLDTFWVTLTDDRVNGVHAPAFGQLVATEFRGVLLEAMGLVLSASILAGAVLGALAGLVVRAVDWAAGRSRRIGWEFVGRGFLLTVAAHGFAWSYDIALRPQLYETWFYARGGWGRTVQLLLTHWLGPVGVLMLVSLLAAGGLALALRPWSELHAGLSRVRYRLAWRRWRGAGVVGLLALGGLGIWWTSPTARARSDRKNLLLIAVDSLRTDRLNPTVMPHMSALGERGARFDRAIVPLPRTFPSWVSLLTGRYPHHHGIRHMFPRWETREADLPTLARTLTASGYRTAAVSDFAGDIFRRADLGFERLVTPTFNLREVVRERVVEAHKPLLPFLRSRWARWALPVLRELHTAADPFALTADALSEIDRDPERPFLLAVFYSTPHFPYAAPAPYFRQFADPSYRGRYLYSKAQLLGQEAPPDEADVRQIRALFDGAVAATDAALGRLLAGLQARGLDGNTIVVFTADHGECLYEPGRGQGHGDHLFGYEAITVPLVIADPTLPPARRTNQVVSTVDVAPTLCELVGARCPDEPDGRSLKPVLLGQPLPAKPVFAETGLWFTESIAEVPLGWRFPYPDLQFFTEIVREHDDEIAIRPEFELITTAAKHRMVMDDRYKLLYMPGRAGVTYQLFDTATDPLEQTNVIQREPGLAQELRQALWSWMLEDRRFERRSGEYLLPRSGELARARAQAQGLRLEEHVR
jgi:arylsulfatase A-like enzyme